MSSDSSKFPTKKRDFRKPDDLRELGFSTEEIGYIEQWAYEYSQRSFEKLEIAYHIYAYAAFATGSSRREQLEGFIREFYEVSV